ncbi:MAG TPA: class IV adenylate cyclase [Chitinophagaceae bacterium]
MEFINIEIKARTKSTEAIRQYLLDNGAVHHGTDEQTDTYFNISRGRLKLREGKVENNLIFYSRPDLPGIKQSDVELLSTERESNLKSVLTKALGVKTCVKKIREIYYIGNIKFHLDTLEGLGSFVEIEASNQFQNYSSNELRHQCEHYLKEFNIETSDLINHSYSDMMIQKKDRNYGFFGE